MIPRNVPWAWLAVGVLVGVVFASRLRDLPGVSRLPQP